MNLQSYADMECNTFVTDDFMRRCLARGINRLTLDNARITISGVLDFCFGGSDLGEERRELRISQLMVLGEDTLDKIVEVGILSIVKDRL